MNLSPYEIAIIAGGFTVIGALLGAWIGYRNALNLNNITAFNKAAAKFRVAFLPELIFLIHDAKIEGTGNTDDLNVFLFHGYVHRHLKAFEVYKSYLSSEERIGIDKAWKEYCHYDIEGETGPHFAMYAESICDGRNTKELALERIEKILKFAEQK